MSPDPTRVGKGVSKTWDPDRGTTHDMGEVLGGGRSLLSDVTAPKFLWRPSNTSPPVGTFRSREFPLRHENLSPRSPHLM